ncbi:MAG: VCBS repeat-containing protein [Chitinophagaceae bacterium]
MNRYRKLFIYITLCSLLACNNKPAALFVAIPSSKSGIEFNNKIVESDSINPLDVVNIYNGGGVGIGDFNNDGLQDIYLTGNQVASRLYLNKGGLKFQDITEKAGVEGLNRWARGVAVIDINNDGLSDIYICNTIDRDSLARRNILYINQGADKNGIPRFTNMAAAYGLELNLQSTMANFFDYDNDGDLDMYLTVNNANSSKNPSTFRQYIKPENMASVGKLYRNNWDTIKGHPFFTDVSAQANITHSGFGHATTICDLNLDGWKDIYVCNDFISSNILYINNHNGTFTDRSKDYFKHTSFNAMGQDIIDINNDGLADVFELDMSPNDNYRRKMMLNANSYVTFQNFTMYGYQFQYVRNTLQLNRGPRLLENDSVGAPVFSETGFMSGVAQTDWSWAPLISDFDNDSYRDIVVTNGFPKDVTDHDFIAYREKSFARVPTMEILKKIPEIKLHNYAFKNQDGLLFKDVTAGWGLSKPSFSNGAAYADLDNDGDLDMVINNINDEASLYENTARNTDSLSSNFLQISFEGGKSNRGGLGTWVSVYYDKDKKQVFENTPYRGYISTDQNMAHFGLGKNTMVDSVVIKWPNAKVQVLKNIKANQFITAKITDATLDSIKLPPLLTAPALFREVTTAMGLNYRHRDVDFIDFNIQTTLPHKLSEFCPALAVGDIDANGFDDIIVGGNESYKGQVFLQQANGKFLQKELFKSDTILTHFKDGGLLLFDANGDGILDLYAVSGGYQYKPDNNNYKDRLYLNDGKGNFSLTADALPGNTTSKLCVRALDYNNDGKIDLFVSGRVSPWHYPKPVSSVIYRNDTEKGKTKFTDVTQEVAPGLKDIGMVCDALVTDFDNDQQFDLILAGEWMPITFFKNVAGQFKNVTDSSGIANEFGWWNSIQAGDFRHTGRTDYIIGNVGLNTLYKATKEYPVFITAKDFDNFGGYEAIPSLYLPDQDGQLKEFPVHGRDDIIDKLPGLKKRFNDYHSFAISPMDKIFTDDQLKGAQRLKVNNSQSCYLRNEGNGKFTMIPLPQLAQVSVLNGMVTDDFDGDGNLDVLINGNDYGTEVSVGRYDALNGLLLKGDGKGNFIPLSILQSGIYIPGNGKALVKFLSTSGKYEVAASQNQDVLKVFELRAQVSTIKLKPGDLYGLITYKDGRIEKRECYYGSSFLSQSGRFLMVPGYVKNVTIINNKEGKRVLNF